jgi:Domain of unknown function (DUF6748)/Kazal-type serine protease inhibitor domain
VKIINFSLVCLATFTFAGCLSDESTDKDLPPEQVSSHAAALGESEGNLPTEIYYSVERDYRMCMAPMCGGYWLKAVNLRRTVCADGTIGGDQGCYVAGVDLHGIELRGGELLHGEFRKVEYGSIVADHLDVDAAFTPALEEAQPYHWINLIQDTGIRCFTTPCPSQRIAMVNTGIAWTRYGFSYGVNDEEQEILEEAFSDAYSTGGALVQSRWLRHGWRWELSVTNVYTRNEAEPTGPFCTFMKREGENSYVAWNVDTYEDGKNLLAGGGFEQGTEGIVEGTCEAYSNVCTEQYAPVCGTIDTTGETKTYSNQCFLEVAVREAAGADAKATGTWTDGECVDQGGAVGDPCGGMLGLTCQDGLFCMYDIAYMCGAYDMTGTCSEVPETCAQVYEPVCGCDGRDYSNECAAWQHGISAAHEGFCD